MKDWSLYIDTSRSDCTLVRLESSRNVYTHSLDVPKSSQNVLPIIEQLFTDSGLGWEHISRVFVHTGPGSFTGLRVGVSIAGTIGFLLGQPVNNKRGVSPPDIHYSKSAFG